MDTNTNPAVAAVATFVAALVAATERAVIIPRAWAQYDARALSVWAGVYFHGLLEDLVDVAHNLNLGDDGQACPPDLVGSNVPLDVIPDGLHEVNVYTKRACLALWTDKHGARRGLVFLPDDERAVREAEIAYSERARVI
jgi:hypothetical protein